VSVEEGSCIFLMDIEVWTIDDLDPGVTCGAIQFALAHFLALERREVGAVFSRS
jgi:hypothetical protein